MSVYRHATADWGEILIEDGRDGRVFAKITDQRASGYHSITLPAEERQAAAQALAGDEYVVVPADRGHATFRVDARCPKCAEAEQPDRPGPVDEGIRVGRVRPDTWAVEQATCVKCAWHSQNRPEPVDPESGAGLIAAERARQINDEGRTAEHDDGHPLGELLDAATTYLLRDPAFWPWEGPIKLTSNNRVRELVKAGALIAAEIDRLHRAEPEPDEAAVEALAREMMSAADVSTFVSKTRIVPLAEHWKQFARELIRSGNVRVVSE